MTTSPQQVALAASAGLFSLLARASIHFSRVRSMDSQDMQQTVVRYFFWLTFFTIVLWAWWVLFSMATAPMSMMPSELFRLFIVLAIMMAAMMGPTFDPAGSWEQKQMPERNDVLYGASPRLEAYYVSFHARETFYVIGQTISVPTDVAERALHLAFQAGSAPKGSCSRFTSRLLRQLPGFESIGQTWFPNNLSDDFAALPNVTTREYREDDEDDKSIAAQRIDATLAARGE